MKKTQSEQSIEHLAAHPSFIPILATWVQKEWGHLTPEVTYEMRVAKFGQRTELHIIPETYVAIENSAPIGMASLIAHDMLARMEFSPWLAAVYVEPAFRNKGVGSRLVRTIMHEAKVLGMTSLYLFTPDRMRFYHRLGWQALERVVYRGESVTIMVYDFSTQS